MAAKAAEQNNADTQNRLGAGYANGMGVERNQVEALKWIRKSAAQGDVLAIQALEEIGEEQTSPTPGLCLSRASGDRQEAVVRTSFLFSHNLPILRNLDFGFVSVCSAAAGHVAEVRCH